MAFVTHTVTGDLRQMFGDAIDITQVAGTVETNLSPGMVMVFDLDNEIQRLGSGKLTIASDGTWALEGVPSWNNTEADQNPTHVQIQVRFEYNDKVTRQRVRWLSGFLQIDHDGSIGEFVAQQLAPADWRSDFMAEAQEKLDTQIDISNIAVSDDVVEALVKNTGGTGPKTSSALSATTTQQINIETPAIAQPLVDAAKPVVVTHPQGINRWRAVFAGAMFTMVRLVIYGDSITAGAYANDGSGTTNADKLIWAIRGWVGQLRARFSKIYGDVGEGYIGFGGDEGRWTYTGTTSSSPVGPARGGRQLNAGSDATATALGPFTTIEYIGYHATGTPPPSLFIDGVNKTPSLMTATQQALAVGASDWINRSNTTLAHGTDSGEDTLQATSAAAGNMSFQTPVSNGNRLTCAAGDKFIVGADINSAVSSRLWRAGMVFYDAANAVITELTTVDATSSTVGSWQTKSNLITAPANTVTASLIVRIDSAAAASEVHTFRRLRAIPVTAVTGQGGATMWRATRSGLSDATHDVSVKGAATGTAFCGGIVISRGTAGVLVSRCGRSGSTTRDFVGADLSASTAENMQIAQLDLMRPDLAIISLIHNDVAHQPPDSQGMTPTTFKANLKTLTDRVAANNGCSLIVIGPRYAVDTSPETQAAFVAKAKELAAESTHVAVVDLGGDQWRTWATANGLGFMFDSVHPTMRGHGDLSRAVYEAITSRALGSLT